MRLHRRMQDTRYVSQGKQLGMLSRWAVMNKDGWSTYPWKDVASGFLGRCIKQTIYEAVTFHIFLPLEIKDGNEFQRKSKNKGAESPRELRPM